MLYAIDKPLGWSSHQVVEQVRRLLGIRRVGHSGTLDPLARGVLVIASGTSTKLVPYLSGEDKEYLAWVSFGATTNTLDAEGSLIEGKPRRISVSELKQALESFLELKEQIPPAYSAIKVQGVRAYEAARRGAPLELAPRPVAYRSVELLLFEEIPRPHPIAPGPRGWELREGGYPVELPPPRGPYPTAIIRLVVGPGTYIRAFARDLGERLGTLAFLSGLIRTRLGQVDLRQATSLPELRPLDPLDVLSSPLLELDPPEVQKARHGVTLPVPVQGLVLLVDHRRQLLAIAEGDGFKLRIRRVL